MTPKDMIYLACETSSEESIVRLLTPHPIPHTAQHLRPSCKFQEITWASVVDARRQTPVDFPLCIVMRKRSRARGQIDQGDRDEHSSGIIHITTLTWRYVEYYQHCRRPLRPPGSPAIRSAHCHWCIKFYLIEQCTIQTILVTPTYPFCRSLSSPLRTVS